MWAMDVSYLIPLGSWEILAKIPVGNATSVLRLLETRTFNLQDLIHKQLITVWKTLVRSDMITLLFYPNIITLSGFTLQAEPLPYPQCAQYFLALVIVVP
jgi:hypothetical protein